MTNIMNKSTMEQTMPSAETGTGFWNTRVNKNQGSGKLQKTKKKEILTLIYSVLYILYLILPMYVFDL